MKRNLIKLKNISLFKIIISFYISIYFKNYFIFFILFIYLFINNIDNLYIFVFLLFLCLINSSLKNDYIRIGIIDYKINNYYLVDNLLYKSILYSDDELYSGDIILFNDSNIIEKDNQLKNNILYYHNDYNKIASFKIRKIINEYINKLDIETKNILYKIFYNQILDYSNYNIIFNGLLSYYFFKDLIKRNKYLGIISLLFYSLLFCFQIKYILIFIDLFLSKTKLNNLDKLSIKSLFIFFLNKYLFNNYSILLPLFINLINSFNLKYKSYLYISLIQSFIFGYTNIIYTFLFNIIIRYKKYFFIYSFFILLFPILNNRYLIEIFNLIEYFNIRGSLSLIGIIIILLISLLNKNNTLLMYLSLIFLLIIPINYPFVSINYIDVGQGDSILIRDKFNQTNILIDTGSIYNYSKLKKYLYQKGIYKIDYLIISHDDNDHNGNIDNLKKDFKINELIMEGKDININNIHLIYYDLGYHENDNDNSLVYFINIDNYAFLFTGDISKNIDRILVDKYINNNHIDFLKVSHHGSKTGTSTYLLENILAKYAIISTSGQYNHPHKETINNLNKYMVKTFITKDDGNIEVNLTYLFDYIKCKNRFVIIG